MAIAPGIGLTGLGLGSARDGNGRERANWWIVSSRQLRAIILQSVSLEIRTDEADDLKTRARRLLD